MTYDRPRFEVLRGPKREKIGPDDFLEIDHQGNLFAAPRRGLLIFVYFPDVTEEEFRNTLINAKPSKVLELRTAPRFDIGNLNRQLAFQLFSEYDAKYIDLTSSGGTSWDSERLLSDVRSFIENSHLTAERPVMILLNKCDSNDEVVDPIRRLITSVIPQFTDLFEVPHFSRRKEFKTKVTSA